MATSGDSNQRSAPIPGSLQPSFNTLQFGTMSDSQLRQTINQLSHAASGAQYQAYAAPTPQRTAGEHDRTSANSSLTSRLYYLPLHYQQLTRKISPTGPHLRPLHHARPRGAVAQQRAAILCLPPRPQQHPHPLPFHTSSLSHTSHNPLFLRFRWPHHPLIPGAPGHGRRYPRPHRRSSRHTPRGCRQAPPSSCSPSSPPRLRWPPLRPPYRLRRAQDAAAS